MIDNEHRYRSVVTAMAEGVVLQDADSVILACNEAAEQLLGLTADEMMGRTSLDPRWRSIREDDSPFPGEEHPVPVTLRTGKPLRNVVMGVHKPDGSLTWISINSEPMFRAGETKPYAAMCTFSDITERKIAEDALRESKERLELALSAGQLGTWEWRLDTNETTTSAQVHEIFGHPPDARLDTAAYFAAIHPDDRPAQLQKWETYLASGLAGSYVNTFRIVRPDGVIRWIRASGRVVALPAGGTRVLGAVVDVTESRALEEQLHEARRLESIGRLAGGIAHDFNNLLTAILASVTFAQQGRPLDEELATIREAADRAAELTGQLLGFARRQMIELAHLDPSALFAGLGGVLRRLVTEDIELTMDLAERLPTIRAGASQLEQVIINLVVNARDAMPEGGALAISSRAVVVGATDAQVHAGIPRGLYVVIAVADTGLGIDAATLPHIFEPFYSTKRHGTGLGLASSYGTIQQLGGYIRVDSEPGRGSTFTVYLPAVQHPPQAPRNTTVPVPVARSRSTILMVEDDELLRRAVVRGLDDAGYDVLVAKDGPEALALAEQRPGRIDVLVTDVVMPGMSGNQLAARIAKMRPETRTLFVSGYSDRFAQGMLECDHHFLAKPYTIEVLARRIDELATRT